MNIQLTSGVIVSVFTWSVIEQHRVWCRLKPKTIKLGLVTSLLCMQH